MTTKHAQLRSISVAPRDVAPRGMLSLETADHVVEWKGFAYLPGYAAGEASLKAFSETLAEDLAGAAAQLKGAYFVSVRDKRSGDQYAFVDPAGLFHAFHSDRMVSPSFLNLAKSERLRFTDLEREALVEFFHFGHVPFGRTLFSQIRRIDPREIVIFPASGPVRSMPRAVRAIESEGAKPLLQNLAELAAAISNQTISVDLTGGIDSRLVATALDSFGLPFEIATSGVAGNLDLAIASEVADALRHPLHIYYHDGGLEPVLSALFGACDGLFDVVRAHRPYLMNEARRTRGVTLTLSGIGGELYKDFWWLQDFPFYRSKPNLRRLYSTRLAPSGLRHELLAAPYRAISEQYRDRMIERLGQYCIGINTESYDQIYFHVKMRDYGGRFITNHADVVSCYAPLLDAENVAFAYHLPRRTRFFNNFHRNTMTALNPTVARIRTTEGGMSVSSERSRIVADMARYAGNKLMRVTRKIVQRTMGKTYFQQSPNSPGLYREARDIISRENAVANLREKGILDSSLELDAVPNSHLGPILTLHLLADVLSD